AEDGIRDLYVTGVQTCALPISVHLCRFFGTVQAVEDDAHTIECLAEAGPQLDGALEGLHGAREVIHVVQGLAEIEVNRAPAGIEIDRAAQMGNRLAPESLAGDEQAQ